MQLMHTFKRTALLVTLAAGLISCASPNDHEIAESFANQRAEMLDSIVPVNMNGYNLIRAKAVSTEIELTLLFSENEQIIPPTALANNLSQAYCVDNEISSLMQKGVSYKLLFRDSRGRAIYQQQITSQNCNK